MMVIAREAHEPLGEGNLMVAPLAGVVEVESVLRCAIGEMAGSAEDDDSASLLLTDLVGAITVYVEALALVLVPEYIERVGLRDYPSHG